MARTTAAICVLAAVALVTLASTTGLRVLRGSYDQIGAMIEDLTGSE